MQRNTQSLFTINWNDLVIHKSIIQEPPTKRIKSFLASYLYIWWYIILSVEGSSLLSLYIVLWISGIKLLSLINNFFESCINTNSTEILRFCSTHSRFLLQNWCSSRRRANRGLLRLSQTCTPPGSLSNSYKLAD